MVLWVVGCERSSWEGMPGMGLRHWTGSRGVGGGGWVRHPSVWGIMRWSSHW